MAGNPIHVMVNNLIVALEGAVVSENITERKKEVEKALVAAKKINGSKLSKKSVKRLNSLGGMLAKN